jgi:AcrR family transcriptional regulator
LLFLLELCWLPGDTMIVNVGTLITGSDVFAISDRDRILQAMAECCSRVGYAATTLEAVLDLAGVELATFESHFADKEDCALAALNKVVSESLARISMVGSSADGVVARRKFEARAILELLAARPSFAELGLIQSRQCGTGRMHDAYESAARVLALMMERVGNGSERPGGISRAALGGTEAVIRRELHAGRAESLPELLPDFVYAALVPLVGQREALRQAKLAVQLAAEEG